MLAGVRNIQPRPVGFKFHAVLVVNSAHLAAVASPEQDRWLPIFWALDQFKSSQARNVAKGDWAITPINKNKMPPAHRAKQAFVETIKAWDVETADVAVAGFARSAGTTKIPKIFSHLNTHN